MNKLAGIDYKQLSLLAKINENQSGEVLYILVFTILFYCRAADYQITALIYISLCVFSCVAVARALARERNRC